MRAFFADRRRLVACLMASLPLAAVLAGGVVRPAGLSLRQSLLLSLPLAVVSLVLLLPVWYVCRALPLGATPSLRLVVSHALAAVVTSVVWVSAGSAAAQAVAALVPDAGLASAYTRQVPALLPAGALLYLLAEYLRKTLAAGDKASVRLEEELDLVRTYLAIEGVRLGARLALEEVCDERGKECRLPPLLLQPLVENAVRHGTATRVEGGVVRLEATHGDGRLRLLVENPRDPEAPRRPGAGLGLANVRQRLLARYGTEALFEAQRLEAGFRVVLSIPAERDD